MATATRQERQLMRQRAGLRDVENIDFDIKFGSHGSREERQFMRSRGAGQRNIENVDFGFTFPTPSQNRRSASKTPQSNNKRASRSSKTPLSRRGDEPATTRSTRSSIATAQRSPTQEQPFQEGRRSTSYDTVLSKRRRTDDVSIPSLRQSLRGRKSSAATFSIAEESIDQGRDSTTNTRGTQPVPDSPLFFPHDGDKENQHSGPPPSFNRSHDKTKRMSAQKLTTQQATSLPDELENSIAPSVEEAEESMIDVSRESADSVIPPRESTFQSKLVAPKQMKRRRKRKTVVLGKKKRRSSGNSSVQSVSVVQAEAEEEPSINDEIDESTMSRIDDEDDQQEEGDSMATSTGLDLSTDKPRDPLQRPRRTSYRNRLSVSRSPAPLQSEDEEGDGTYVDEEHTPDPTTPAPKRKTVNKRRPSDRGRPVAVKQRKTNSGSSFPILTHRMTNFHTLPTIPEERNLDRTQDEDEEQWVPDLFMDRAVPNAVDVLAQICRETIEGAVDQLRPQPGSSRPRGELTSKRTALQAFGKELDQRLFDMSEAVEYRLTLEARLRKSKREMADMQAQWIDIRRQRDDLGLRADAIRRQNWENEEKSRCQWEASRLAQQAELHLEQEPSSTNLEFELRTLGARVSSSSVGSGCGFLHKVKSFNAQLERVATMLEGR